MARPTIADQALALLLERGPLALDELTDLLVAAGATKAKKPKEVVRETVAHRQQFTHLTDGRWASSVALVRGRVFTHRLSQDELDREELDTLPDLSPLTVGFDADLSSNLGAVRTRREVGWKRRSVTGDRGWLNGWNAGDLMAVSRDGDHLHFAVVGEPDLEPELDELLVDRVRHDLELLARTTSRSEVVGLSDRVLAFLHDHPQAFTRPGLSLPERLQPLEVLGSLVGLPGTDWTPWDWNDLDEDDEDVELESLLSAFHLDSPAAQGVRDLLPAMWQVADGAEVPGAIQLGRLAAPLGRARAGAALCAYLQSTGELHAVDPLFTALVPLADGAAKAAVLAALALHAEEHGKVDEADELASRAVRASPADPFPLLLAARYAEDRGDARTALDLQRKAGIPANDPDVLRLRRWAEPPTTGTSRNAPCPCGSGKKHKACCLAKAQHPLEDRARWLWAKLSQWLLLPTHRKELFDLVAELAPNEPAEWVARAQGDPFTHDLMLWGDELIHDFATRRGPALPPDEADLLQRWLTTPLALWEVTNVKPHRGVQLRDMDDDHEVFVHERLGSTQLSVGDVLLARVLPDGGDGFLFSSLIGVPRGQRPQLAAALRASESPEAVAIDWLRQASAPPEMRTKQGYPLVLCTGAWSVPDPAAAQRALAAELGDDELLLKDGDSILAKFDLDGSELTASTMARETWDQAAALVQRVLPTARLVTSEFLPGSELAGRDRPLAPRPEEQSPEMLEALEAFIVKHEQEWVDTEIPALGGLTPRQSLQDPRGKRDLLALLDDFGDDEQPGAMSSRRLRGLLGL